MMNTKGNQLEERNEVKLVAAEDAAQDAKDDEATEDVTKDEDTIEEDTTDDMEDEAMVDEVTDTMAENVGNKEKEEESVLATEDAMTDEAGNKEKEEDLLPVANVPTLHEGQANISSSVPILELMRAVVTKKNDNVFATWYGVKGQVEDEYTFGKMWSEAGVIACHLRNENCISKGDRVILCYNFGLHFFAAFLGCLKAGAVAVIVYPPSTPLIKSLPKMSRVVEDCGAKLILMDETLNLLKTADQANPFSKSRHLWPTKDSIDYQVTSKLLKKSQKKSITAKEFVEKVSPTDLAFLQYTSGSTGIPKGVMVTFGALSANVQLIHKGYCKTMAENGLTDDFVGFSWLPQYHDLGLIFTCIAPFAAGFRQHMMSPMTFVHRPLLWLDLMSRHKVNWSASPDFGLRLVSRKFLEKGKRGTPMHPIADLDLSSIVGITVGAEPVRPDSVKKFGDLFGAYKLREKWLQGGYGLAEHVVSACWINGTYLSVPRVDGEAPLVACGLRQNFGTDLVVKIVSPETLEEVKDGETGEIWLAGHSVTAGYFNNSAATAEVFGKELANSALAFLRTGDLGFFQEDKLFICGRIKDVVIVNGVNYFPQDVEFAVEMASQAVRPGCVAAFSSDESAGGGDLHVVFEIRKGREAEAASILEAVRQKIVERIGLLPSRIVAIQEKAIPKTTSGKIQRRETRSSLQQECLPIVQTMEQPRVLLSSSEILPESDIHLPRYNSDVVVVGAGIVGLCFARDIASLGYTVTVVERSSQVGGVWAQNNYAGLRLHSPGYNYRCVSVVPSWNLEHSAEENYRPTRDEVLSYCKKISQHENVEIVLDTNCDYENWQVFANGISVQIGAKQHRTRFLFVSGSATMAWSGSPHFPNSVPESFHSREQSPMCLHSSLLTTEKVDMIRKEQRRVVIVGAGKAAIDILQLFSPACESVLWAHRGHTAFFRREKIGEFIGSGIQATYVEKARIEGRGRNWSSLAVEDGIFFTKCAGPLTSQKVKSASGICSQEEILHANSFRQFHLDSIEVSEERPSIKLLGKDRENNVWVAQEDDCVIFCTGQRNRDFSPPKIAPNYAQSGIFSTIGPMSTLVPLRLAVEQLRGKRDVSNRVEPVCKSFARFFSSAKEAYKQGRELDSALAVACAGILGMVFPSCGVGIDYRDPAFYPKWTDEWYARNVVVDDVFQSLDSGFHSPVPHVLNPSRLVHPVSAESDSGAVRQPNLLPATAEQDPHNASVISEITDTVSVLLGIDRQEIKPGADLMEIGINSFQASQLISDLNEKYQGDFSHMSLMEHTTIEALAKRVEGEHQAPGIVPRKLVSSSKDETSTLETWFARRRSSGERDGNVLLFCFPGIGGNSSQSFMHISKELPSNIVPYVVVYPWEKPELEPTLMSNVSQYVDCLCATIAKRVRGYNDFALFGHSAGGCLAYLVERRLRAEQFDLAPVLTIVANALPPPLAASMSSLLVPALVSSIWKDNPEMAAYMTRDWKHNARFWRSVWSESRRVWRSDAGVGSRLLVLGGTADRSTPPVLLKKWWSSKAHEATLTLKIFKRGDHFTPRDVQHRVYREFWAAVGQEVSAIHAVSDNSCKGFGPIRTSLRTVSEIEFQLYQAGLVHESYVIRGWLCFDGILSLETVTKRVEEVAMSDPRFLRFRSKISLARKEWIPIEKWTASSHIYSSTANPDVEHVKSKLLWTMRLEQQHQNTILHFRCNHAVGDGFCLLEFLKAVTGSTPSAIPSILLRRPPLGSACRKSTCCAYLKRVHEKYPLPLSRVTSNSPGAIVVPLELASLSLRFIKTYAKERRATVNDVLLMIISEVKNRIGEPHNWLCSMVSSRTASNRNLLRNVSECFPVFVGDGKLVTISKYTSKWKFLLYLGAHGAETSIKTVDPNNFEGSIVSLSNLIGLQTGGISGHRLTGQSFHVSVPRSVYVLSMGDRLRCTYAAEESNLEDAYKIQEVWLSVVMDLGLALPSRRDDSEPLSASTLLPEHDGQPLQNFKACVHESKNATLSLDEYTEFQLMNCRSDERVERITCSFDGVVIILPNNYRRECCSIEFKRGISAADYHKLAIGSHSRASTESGQTILLVAREVAFEEPSTFAAEYDESLRADPCIFQLIQAQTNSRSLRIVRHFEYFFGGKAGMSVMALYVKSLETGQLSLVEVVRKGPRTAAQTKGCWRR